MFDLEPSQVSFFGVADTHLEIHGDFDLYVDNLPNMDCFPCSSPAFISTDGSFDSSSNSFLDSILMDEFDDNRLPVETMRLDIPSNGFELNLEELESDLLDEDIECMRRWLEEEESPSPSQSTVSNETSSTGVTSNALQIILPMEIVEAVDDKVSLHHLSMAYGEAIENKNAELADVLRRRICEKVSPLDGPLERALCYIFDSSSKEFACLQQESTKNFFGAFRAICQILPYAMVAHSMANSAILEAMPKYTNTIMHIYDFDMGDGLQWSSLIEAVGQQQNPQKSMKLTSIRWRDENELGWGLASSRWGFEETKERLEDHARESGIRLEVSEVELHDLESDVEKAMDGGREFMAFNCMTGLPHMGRRRRRSHVMGFLRVAKDSVAKFSSNNVYDDPTDKGIVAFVDGDVWRRPGNGVSSFGMLFMNYIDHYRSLLESVEMSIPCHLGEARMAMESLFVAPLASIDALSRQEMEDFEFEEPYFSGLNCCKASHKSLMEATEIVREGESLYRVWTEEDDNVVVLEWRETPLLKICLYR